MPKKFSFLKSGTSEEDRKTDRSKYCIDINMKKRLIFPKEKE